MFNVLSKIPLEKYAALLPHLIGFAHVVYDFAKQVRAGTLTIESAKIDADKAWNDFWTIVMAVEAH